MKSKKAQEYIDDNSISDVDLFDSEEPAIGESFVSVTNAEKAVELAEEETVQKAVTAFCKANREVCGNSFENCTTCYNYHRFKSLLNLS